MSTRNSLRRLFVVAMVAAMVVHPWSRNIAPHMAPLWFGLAVLGFGVLNAFFTTPSLWPVNLTAMIATILTLLWPVALGWAMAIFAFVAWPIAILLRRRIAPDDA